MDSRGGWGETVWKKEQGRPRRKEKGWLFQRIQNIEIKLSCRLSSLKAQVLLG